MPTKQGNKQLRQNRVRAKVSGTGGRPRLSVARGTKSMCLQLIDDVKGVTIASAYERELSKEDLKKTKTERAAALGALIGKKAKERGVTSAVFDRGGNAYHGRVKAVAESAREAGLTI